MKEEWENNNPDSNQHLEEVIWQEPEPRPIQLKANRPVLTYALIAVNILVFGLLSLLSLKPGASYNELLTVFGAKVNSRILSGEYWRLLTPIFLHGGIVHLLINCYSLYSVGVTVEKVFGHVRFLSIYLAAGVMGNIFSLMFSMNPAVGASGAIFGLLGTLLYFGLEKPAHFKVYFGYSVISTIIINLGYGFSRSGIDNFGHIGGLVGGFLISGAVIGKARTKWYLNRLVYVILLAAVSVSGIWYGFNNSNNRAAVLLQEMRQYDQSENWNRAEVTAEEILDMKSINKDIKLDVLWTVSKAEAMAGKFDQALEHARTLVKLSAPDGHYLSGVIYYNMQQFDRSKEELLKARELNAQYANIDELLTNIEQAQKKK